MTPRSFLPQIVGLFYAVFDPKLGPTVTHQVPENLITSSSHDEPRSRSISRSRSRSRPRARSRSISSSPSSSSSEYGRGPAEPPLLDFAPISEYVIPKKSLTEKLVTLLTTSLGDEAFDFTAGGGRGRSVGPGGRGAGSVGGAGGAGGKKEEYRIMGFPCVLSGEGGRYVRNEFMWNLCFVFEGKSSLEAFEPVVRKCARILRSAELDSAYLSAPNSEHTSLHAVLEQLFEDLNSYSETSIPLDGFNSLELKLFPFYPNPTECEDWHVPVALVDLNALKDDNWDITAARVSQYIDGVNHVLRIAELVDADPALTRETLKHMLFYQVIMMVDVFQYSNMYTLKPNITRLSADESISSECATYVVRRGFSKPPWPVLLRLYSKLQPGTTIHSWIEASDVLALGIDARRFVSFGIIKGFLRRVHRWPFLVDRKSPLLGHVPHEQSRRKVEFDKRAALFGSGTTLSTKPGDAGSGSGIGLGLTRSGPGDSTFTLRSTESHTSLGLGLSPSSNRTPPSATRSPARRQGQLTNMRDSYPRSLASASNTETHLSIGSRQRERERDRTAGGGSSGFIGGGGGGGGGGHIQFRSTAIRLREAETRAMEEELVRYLDGMHHTDEIQVRFRLGWKDLERILGVGEVVGGKGKKGVALIYR